VNNELLQGIHLETVISWGVSIIGWLVTIFAAVIPLRSVKQKQLTFEQELARLKKARAESIDHATFQNERQDLIKKLSSWQRGLKLGNVGNNSLHTLDQTITRIESHAKRLQFDQQDQKTISQFKKKIEEAITTKETQQFSEIANGKIEEIKMILQKGAYQIW